MLSFIDTHTHIYEPEFAADREAVITRAQKAGAIALFLPNCDAASIEPMLSLCRQYSDFCRPMLGLHPTELPEDPEPVLRDMEQRLAAPAHPYIGIGEVGLDFYWDTTRRDEQIRVFGRQIGWASSTGLPLSIHARAALPEVVSALSPYKGRLTGVFHCFTGTKAEAHALLAFDGFALGIGGVITFKKSGPLRETLRTEVPLERIVLETDAPYLSPEPYRGRRNEPAYLTAVIDCLAKIYATTPEEMARQTTLNALRVFPRAQQQALAAKF